MSMMQFSEVNKYYLVSIGEVIGCTIYWWGSNHMLVFGEVKKWVWCNLVRLTNLDRFLLMRLLNVLFSGEVKKWYAGSWWGLTISMMQFSEAKKLKPLPEDQASEYNTMVWQKQNTPKVFQCIWWGHWIWETFSVAFR